MKLQHLLSTCATIAVCSTTFSEIIIDENHIPHIFAKNDNDLCFAQGYITAFDRLWQMEFQTMAAAGRLSEIIGETFLGI